MAGFLEHRLPLRRALRTTMRKLFPSHWSFLLGEVALFSFLGLVVSGVYLAFFYDPSLTPVAYHGAYPPLEGQTLPGAFVSVLHLSLGVPFGLVVRRFHHFAAHLFIAALLLHAARVFFTGAFRRPRELTWWLGLGLFALALTSGFTGYCLPFDMRGGSATRMLLTTCESIPWVGGWLATFVFAAPFPGPYILHRLYIAHVLLVPALICGVLALHLYLVVRLTHTQYPSLLATERMEIGGPAWPDQAARSLTLMFLVFALCALLAAFFPVEAIWIYGPWQPFNSHAPLTPDWFLLWVEGAFRLLPRQLDFHLLGANFTNPFYGTVVLSLVVFGGCAFYPRFEQRFIYKRSDDTHLCEHWTERPFRTAFGAAGISFLLLLSIGALNEQMAAHFGSEVWEVNVVWGILTLAAQALFFLLIWAGLRGWNARGQRLVLRVGRRLERFGTDREA